MPRVFSNRSLLKLIIGLTIILIGLTLLLPLFGTKSSTIEVTQVFRRPADVKLALQLGEMTDEFATEGHHGGVLRQFYIEDIKGLIPGETTYDRETTVVLWGYDFIPRKIYIQNEMMIVTGADQHEGEIVFALVSKDALGSFQSIEFSSDRPTNK